MKPTGKAPLSAFAARKLRLKPTVESEVAVETYQVASEGNNYSPTPFIKPINHTIRKKSCKRKRIVADLATRNSTEPSSAPAVHLDLSEEKSEEPQLDISVELNGLGYTSKNKKSGATTSIAVVDAGWHDSSSNSDIGDDEYDSFGDDVQRPPLHNVPEQRLSTFSQSETNILSSSCEEWTIRLTDGDILVFVGQYDIWVRKGTVTILGAVLHPSARLHRIYAPSTHALPAIRHLRSPFGPPQQPAVITIKSCGTGIRLLRSVSRKFARIWNRVNAYERPEPMSAGASLRSFSYLNSTSDDLYRRTLEPVKIPIDWQSKLVELLDHNKSQTRVIMVCGPKSSGKSTFVRLLTNELLSRPSSSSGVALLDLDPGQPEYSPPGDISLVQLKSYNLGPPYVHPLIPNDSEDSMIRAHHVGSISPRDDPYHYVLSAVELHTRYQQILSGQPSHPLIVNCCGWIQGSGLEILEQLILTIRPTDVIYMSKTGPEEVTDVLQVAADRTGSLFHTLSSQPSGIILRTGADLRMMQTLSYFHIDASTKSTLRWDRSPIHTVRPLVFHYAGPHQVIVGIMILGEEIPVEQLADLIDGSVLGVVAIEHDSALPEDILQIHKHLNLRSQSPRERNPDAMDLEAASVFPRDEFNRADISDLDSNDADEVDAEMPDCAPGATMPRNPARPSISRTKEGLPYFFTGVGACVPLDPSRSHCIGQVLVRAIDVRSQALQVITPIPAATFQRYRDLGVKLMLVRGKLDVPAWAYGEECVASIAAQHERARWRRYREAGEVQDSDEGVSDPEDFDVEAWARRTPWVSVVKKGKNRKDRVWKVRRNLQTKADRARND